MTFNFCSFSSGSSGNCYLVKTETTAVLVDGGISAVQIISGLHRTRTATEDVRAILLTHEHSDHVSGVAAALKQLPRATVCANEGTLAKMRANIPEDRKSRFETGDAFRIGDIEVKTFGLSHDAADPVGYSLRHEGKTISIVTDTGVVTEDILSETVDADILVLEANHDVEMLRNGGYPPFLKKRIAGVRGHLSNAAAGQAILDMMAIERKARCVLLAHLSHRNNDPRLAEQTVANMLAEMDYHSGRDLYLKPILRNRLSRLFEI
ncbi:MAG: MBL fold metallo-hydrolase [Clostridiales Family XIII bacterium]|jgi:phosphoribosyl 1,2-cyclic phosphodiesterase|nr:MBL fold metallo-hydrolase [Clostridiales Family XIII bacterium]